MSAHNARSGRAKVPDGPTMPDGLASDTRRLTADECDEWFRRLRRAFEEANR